MKKKALSFILTAAMLGSMLVQPMNAIASEEDFAEEIVLDDVTEFDETDEFDEVDETDTEETEVAPEDGETISEDAVTGEAEAEEFDEIEILEEDDGFVGEAETLEGGTVVVESVEINKIVEPSPVAIPSDTRSLGDDSLYKFYSMKWYDATDKKYIFDLDDPSLDGYFEQGHEYILYIYLNPTLKSEFPESKESMTATINGMTAQCTKSDISGAELKIYRKYHCASVQNEAKIINVVEPVALNTPDYLSPVPDTTEGEYGIVDEEYDEGEYHGITWYNDTDSVVMHENDVFEAGKIYRVSIRVETNSGYVFPTNAIWIDGTINGRPAGVKTSEILALYGTIILEQSFECDQATPELAFENTLVEKRYGCRPFKNPLKTCVTDGAVVYSSSDEEIADVDPVTGEVTVFKDGIAVITATSAETKTYHEGTINYLLEISPLPKLKTPAKPTLANTSNGVKITWKAVAGAEKYRVFRKKLSGSGWDHVAVTTGLSCVDTTAKSGVKYTYTVRCLNNEETKYMSDYDPGASITYVEPPVITSLINLEKGIQIDWKVVSGASQYRVFYRESGTTAWFRAGDTTTTSLVYNDTSVLTKGKSYDFTVRCMNSSGKYVSVYDSIESIIYTPQVIVPDDVVLVSASAVSGGIKVVWKKANKAVKYKVYRKRWDETSWKGIATVSGASSVSYVDNTAQKGIRYYYTVRALSNSAYSASYDKVGRYAMITLTAPQITSLTNAANGLKISWNSVSGAAKYRVMTKNSSGAWVTLKDVTGTSYTVTTLTSGVSHTFTVRCVASDGSYATSGYNSTGKSLVYLKAPSTSAYKESTGIRVSWTTTPGANGYFIYRKTDSTGWSLLATAKNVSIDNLLDSKASKNVKYYYMVRAYKGNPNGDYMVSGYNASNYVIR